MFAGNALITKIKSIYANHITGEQYQILLKKKSVSEFAGYLKTLPQYKALLSGIAEGSLHRGRLEGLLKKNSFEQMMKLIKFVKMKDESFYRINIIAREHDIILSLVKSFISDEQYDIVSDLPVFFDQHSKLDLLALSKTTNLKELVAALDNTSYATLLKPYENISNERINYFMIESFLENEYYKYVFKQINDHYKGKLKDELLLIFRTKIEISNIIKIYRLKKFYKVDKDYIRSMLIPSYTRLDQVKIDEILAIEQPDQIFSMLANSKYAKFIDNKDQVYLEYYQDYIKYYLAKKNIYYSSNPAKVFLSFMLLNEIEINNLFHIIEGIRYQVDEKEIRMMLVY